MRPAPQHPLVRVLSKLGVCSRMQAVDMVLAGRVRVNGRTVREPGAPCGFHDRLEVDGRPVGASRKRYLLLNKPAGVVTTRADERGRSTVYELLSGVEEWVVPVGRLDRDSEGLLVLTNDTRFSAWLTDPGNALPRVYEATVRPRIPEAEVATLMAGVDIGRGEISRPTSARALSSDLRTSTVEVTITEGRNREIRRLFQAKGWRVLRLRRTRFGPFELGELASGTWKDAPITEAEAKRLAAPPRRPDRF